MSDLQSEFIERLVNLAPEGITARVMRKYANTGVIYYQDDDFQTVLAVSYDFQNDMARFNLSPITDAEKVACGARDLGTRPQNLSWDGWYAKYLDGGLKKVRDGVDWLLNTRCTGGAT